MHYFVTGASGLIGRGLVKELIASGHTVLGLARSDKSAELVESLGAEVHRGDLNDLESLRSGAAKSDGVAHLAFVHDFQGEFDFPGWCRIDQTAIKTLGEALKGTNKPLVIASGTLLLAKGRVATEEDKPDLNDPIAGMRGPSEGVTLDFVSQGVRAMVTRLAPTNHGPEDHGFVTMLIAKAREAGFAAYVGDGANTWTAVHKTDTSKLFALALEKGQAGAIFHAVAEQGVPLKDIAEAIGKKAGVPAKSITMEEAQSHFGPVAFAMIADNKASNEITRKAVGWNPTHPTLLEDLASDVYA